MLDRELVRHPSVQSNLAAAPQSTGFFSLALFGVCKWTGEKNCNPMRSIAKPSSGMEFQDRGLGDTFRHLRGAETKEARHFQVSKKLGLWDRFLLFRSGLIGHGNFDFGLKSLVVLIFYHFADTDAVSVGKL